MIIKTLYLHSKYKGHASKFP